MGGDGERGPIIILQLDRWKHGGRRWDRMAHWPWRYYDIVPRLKEYVAFHARHINYPVDYLGTLYFAGPFRSLPIRFQRSDYRLASSFFPGSVCGRFILMRWNPGRRFSFQVF